MTLPVFERMTRRLLAHLGEEAILRGELTVRANVADGTDLVEQYGEVVIDRDVVTIESRHVPQVGDELQVGLDHYVLDVRLKDNGVSTQFILRDANF